MRTIDSHTHSRGKHPQALISQLQRYNYEYIGVLAMPDWRDQLNNLHVMEVKKLLPGQVYAYCGMQYLPGIERTGKNYLRQLEMLMEAGFDGWKIIETKPNHNKWTKAPLDGEMYEPSFAMAEAERIPITWHCADPATFWNMQLAPQWAIEAGWVYDESFPTMQELYRQTEAVLERHPKLNVTLAHLYFVSDDIEHGRRLLDKYENLRFDLCPGFEMFEAFVKEPEKWHNFFVQYQDRIIFGTDREDDPGDVSYGNYDGTYNYFLRALFKNEPIDRDGLVGRGVGLGQEIHDKLFSQNFLRAAGGPPKAINKPALRTFGQWLLGYIPQENRAECERLMELLCS